MVRMVTKNPKRPGEEELDPDQVDALVKQIRPNIIILPAAMANVNLCEKEPELGIKNNVQIVKNFIHSIHANKLKSKIVFFSTDYLFDGKYGPYSEDAQPTPLNQYGKIKLMCEQELIKSKLDYLIIRTTGVFGWEMQRKNFVYRVLDTLSAGKELTVPNDQIYNPTYVIDLAANVLSLLKRNEKGIFHVAGPSFMDREKWTIMIADAFSLDKKLIVGKPTEFFNDVAKRPLKGGLKIDKIRSLGMDMRLPQDALIDMKARKLLDDKYD